MDKVQILTRKMQHSCDLACIPAVRMKHYSTMQVRIWSKEESKRYHLNRPLRMNQMCERDLFLEGNIKCKGNSQQHRQITKTSCWVKKSGLKKKSTDSIVQFIWYSISNGRKKTSSGLGLQMGWGLTWKGH